MKIAVTVWNDRISPVFDVARTILVLSAESGQLVQQGLETFTNDQPMSKVLKLAELGVTTLICGAISRPLADLVSARGIQLIPFVAGDIDEVIDAYQTGDLPSSDLVMPGCRRRRGRCCQGDENRRGAFGTFRSPPPSRERT